MSRMTDERFNQITTRRIRGIEETNYWAEFLAERQYAKELEVKLAQVKVHAVGIWCAKGCTCCEDTPAMELHETELAKLLDIAPYDDGSGYDYYSVRDQLKEQK